MQRSYKLSEVTSPIEILRKAGYAYFRDPQSGEESFVLRLTTEFYPRFHVYVEGHQETVTFNLHLDQKKPSYGGSHKHSGEYDGPTVEKELQRLDGWVRSVTQPANTDKVEHDLDNRNQLSHQRPGTILKRLWTSFFRKSRY